MKITVFSDLHGSYSLLLELKNIEFDSDIFISLGDNELPDYLINDLVNIKGNNDYSTEFPLSKDLNIKGTKIHLEHGHNINYMYFDNYVENFNTDIFLFGHLHKRLDFKIKNTLVLNPGSLSRPRDNDKGTYLIIYLDDNNKINYEFKEISLG